MTPFPKTDREVDFVIKRGAQVVELIQVCYSIEDEQTRKREIAALKAASRELESDIAIPCTLLTMDKEEEMDIPGFKINVRNLIDWLLFP